MGPIVLAAITNHLWYLLPLIVSISLVYGATRHEHMGPILQNAVRFGTWFTGFIAIVFGVLFVLSLWNG